MDLNTLKREDVKVVADELAEVLAETIADYEQRSGKVLQPAHIERLIINTFAYRETLLRRQVNEAYRQQHPRFATGLMLDLCGDDVTQLGMAAKIPSFNTQPPEGGWAKNPLVSVRLGVSTHSRPKAAE